MQKKKAMAERGNIKHQKRYPEPVPEDVEQQGAEAVAAWRQAKAAAWKTEHAIRVEDIEKDAMLRSREQSASLMNAHPDIRTYICRMLDPVTMFMIYDADQIGNPNSFHNWCNTESANFHGKKQCIWDVLLLQHYGNVADPNIDGTSVDQKRWKFYAYWLTDDNRLETNAMYFGSAGAHLDRTNEDTLRRSYMYRLTITRYGRLRCDGGSLIEIDEDNNCPFTKRLMDNGIIIRNYSYAERYWMIWPKSEEFERKEIVDIIMIMLSIEGITYMQPWPLDANLLDKDTQFVYIHATCIGCNSNATTFVCGGCEEVGYCGKACATKDWHQNGHKDSCGAK